MSGARSFFLSGWIDPEMGSHFFLERSDLIEMFAKVNGLRDFRGK